MFEFLFCVCVYIIILTINMSRKVGPSSDSYIIVDKEKYPGEDIPNTETLRRLNQVAKKNKVLLNPKFSVVDLSKIKD